MAECIRRGVYMCITARVCCARGYVLRCYCVSGAHLLFMGANSSTPDIPPTKTRSDPERPNLSNLSPRLQTELPDDPLRIIFRTVISDQNNSDEWAAGESGLLGFRDGQTWTLDTYCRLLGSAQRQKWLLEKYCAKQPQKVVPLFEALQRIQHAVATYSDADNSKYLRAWSEYINEENVDAFLEKIGVSTNNDTDALMNALDSYTNDKTQPNLNAVKRETDRLQAADVSLDPIMRQRAAARVASAETDAAVAAETNELERLRKTLTFFQQVCSSTFNALHSVRRGAQARSGATKNFRAEARSKLFRGLK